MSSDRFKTILRKTQFVENIKAKRKALGQEVGSDASIGEEFEDAKRKKASGGADPNRKLKQSRKAAKKDRKARAKTPRSATPRETVLGSRPRTKRA